MVAMLQHSYSRYLVASVASLGCDMSTFLALHAGGVPAVAALAFGYMLGVMVHWIISTRFVFDGAISRSGAERTKAKGLFVLTALMGLVITMAIGGAADLFGFDTRIAKLVAVAVSFQATYMARRAAIFGG